MSSSKTTIFRQLIFNIIFPTLLVLIVFALINFYNTKSLITRANDEKNTFISNEITRILFFQDFSFDLIDRDLNSRFTQLSSLLRERYFQNTDEIQNADLIAIREKAGMDTLNEDIYIISSNGIIVNTTKKMDLNLNLFGFGEMTKRFILDVLKNDGITNAYFAIEQPTKRVKKYSYQPTKDRKYIIELGTYSTKAEDILKAVENTKNELKNEVKGIIDVELFLYSDRPFTLNKNALDLLEQRDSLARVFHDKDTISFIMRSEKSWLQYQYLYVERTSEFNKASSDLYRGSVIRLISDRTSQMNLFRKEIKNIIILFIPTLFILSLLIYRKVKVITLPIKKLVENVDKITKGDLKERAQIIGNNEISTLATQFNNMVETIELKNNTLLQQKTEIETANSEIISSIRYAKYIQSAVLPGKDLLDSFLKDYFVLIMPREIVSGDFYWVANIGNITIVAAVDCTGHGVPGAFMSLLGNAFLNEIVNKDRITDPGVILQRLRKEVVLALQQKGEFREQKDGMDIALCAIDYDNMKLQFAGANNPFYLIRSATSTRFDVENRQEYEDLILYEFKGDKMPISFYDLMDRFTVQEIDILKGDMLYLFSDGYADQFGGAAGTKLGYKNFQKLLLNQCTKPLEKQKDFLNKTLEKWKGEFNQIDDILVIGIKIG